MIRFFLLITHPLTFHTAAVLGHASSPIEQFSPNQKDDSYSSIETGPSETLVDSGK